MVAATLIAATVTGCSEPATATVATVGGVEVRAIRTDQGTCLALIDAAQGGMSSCQTSGGPDVMSLAAMTVNGAGNQAILSGSLPHGVTSLTLTQEGTAVEPRLVATELGQFFVATGLHTGDVQLAATGEGGRDYSATISLEPNGVTSVTVDPVEVQ